MSLSYRPQVSSSMTIFMYKAMHEISSKCPQPLITKNAANELRDSNTLASKIHKAAYP